MEQDDLIGSQIVEYAHISVLRADCLAPLFRTFAPMTQCPISNIMHLSDYGKAWTPPDLGVELAATSYPYSTEEMFYG